jgi:hypothetical protein
MIILMQFPLSQEQGEDGRPVAPAHHNIPMASDAKKDISICSISLGLL